MFSPEEYEEYKRKKIPQVHMLNNEVHVLCKMTYYASGIVCTKASAYEQNSITQCAKLRGRNKPRPVKIELGQLKF